ncbi:MAG: glycosyltransferase, partial [Cytophagales bacterium]|nr:glycosyltransferase [Armatimonadota bacterium]
MSVLTTRKPGLEPEPVPETHPQRVVILIPVFNDWAAVTKLLALLDDEIAKHGYTNASVLLIDDGSSLPAPEETIAFRPQALIAVEVLALRRNLGHQRAIAVGLTYVSEKVPCRAVVVMDGDGEDSPGDVPKLLARFEELGGAKAVFAERARRTEKLSFRVFYRLYKGAHRLLTGEGVRVGNFSAIPFKLLSRLVVVSDLWNHYAAAVFKARLPHDMLPLARGYRLAGESRMNFVSLVIHGLSAMSVYGDRIGVRLLTVTGASVAGMLLLLSGLLLVKFVAGIAVSKWVAYSIAGLLIILSQMLAIALVFVFIVLAGRDSSSFLPIRDYHFYIGEVYPIWPGYTG